MNAIADSYNSVTSSFHQVAVQADWLLDAGDRDETSSNPQIMSDGGGGGFTSPVPNFGFTSPTPHANFLTAHFASPTPQF